MSEGGSGSDSGSEHEPQPEPQPEPAEPEPAPVTDPVPGPAPLPASASVPDSDSAYISDTASVSASDSPYGPVADAAAPPPEPWHDDEDPLGRPRSRRTMAIAAAAIVVGLTIATLVFLGRANAQRYLLVCGTDHVSAEQGRSFPPWGSHAMTGAPWQPIALPPSAECTPRETDDLAELGGWYLAMLIERASATLSAHDLLESLPSPGAGSASPNALDLASSELDQALLLARAPERRDERAAIERLEGDVAYWRAQLRLRDATAALADAAKQLDAAGAHHPRFASDAGAWATLVRRLVGDLHAGPGAEHAASTPPAAPPATPAAPAAPPGHELPVEPPAGSGSQPPAPAPAPIDAGVPTGGVLL